MGNYKFRLSDMIPNAWFYKLKDMGNKPKPRNQNNTSHHSTNKKQTYSSKPKPAPPQQQPSQFIQHRNSYYFNNTEAFRSSDKLYNSPINPKATDVHFPDSPRKYSKRKSRNRPIKPNSKLVSSSVSAGCSCRATFDSVWLKSNSNSDSSSLPSPESNFHEPSFEEFDPQGVWSSNSCSCRVSSSATDIIIDVDSSTTTSTTITTTTKSPGHKFDLLDSISELDLPPILTKPVKFNEMVCNIKNRESHVETEETGESIRVRRRPVKGDRKFDKVDNVHKTVTQKQHRISPKSSAMSPGVKLRSNSPRIASKKIQAYTRKTTIGATTTNSNTNKTSSMSRKKRVSESFAIVKSSFDPQRDFRESMVEMIVENNIRASKDLEELLACYLSLNSNEYHDLIVKVFEQIWFDLTDI